MIYTKLKKYVPEKIHLIFLAIILALLSSASAIFAYWKLYKFLESILVAKDYSLAIDLGFSIVLFLILEVVLLFLGTWATHILAFRLETNLKVEGIKRISESSFAYFDKNESGKISKILNDNTALTHMSVAHLIPDLSAAIFIPIFGMVLFFKIDLRLASLLVVSVALGVFLTIKMFGERSFMKDYMLAQEKMNAGAVEYVRGINVLKIFKANIKSLKDFYKSVSEYSRLAFQYSLSCRKWYVWFQLFYNSIFLVLVLASFYFIGNGSNPMVYLTKTIFYVSFAGVIFTSAMKIMYLGQNVFLASNSINKIEEVFEQMKEKKLDFGSNNEINSSDIEFKNVGFSYDKLKVIDNLSFKLDGKKTYALVGSSGSGKSTIAKLISGFYALDDGEILIGGRNISDYSQKTISSSIANVFQDAKLFKTSIYENVKIGNPNASKEEILEAMHMAQCDSILDKFEDREDTIIGSKGVHLSGGEVQRITIARAILKDAKIIILDEASAAADPENEFELQKAIANLMKERTVIMIAHRLSTIVNVDEVLVIEQGRVIERGSHKELMQKDSKYKKLQDEFKKANEWRIS